MNESLLLDEADIEAEDQVGVLTRPGSGTRHSMRISSQLSGSSTARLKTALNTSTALPRERSSRRINTATTRTTAILTGRVPGRISRQSSASRTGTSYRPLTVNLTATQAAFSRSTRLLLKYSTCRLLSKLAFEYLYNAQSMNNKCPDHRQCLEYLNLVENGLRNKLKRNVSSRKSLPFSKISDLVPTSKSELPLGLFWLISFGSCYFNLHMNREAEEYFSRAVSLDPKHLDSYTWLVKIYLRANQPAKVLKVCRDGLSQSRNAILYNWMARVQSLTGDPFGANANLRESLKFYPTNIEALANVAYFNFYADRMEHSLRCFKRIEQLSINQSVKFEQGDLSGCNYGSSAQLLNNLALCNFYSGFYHKAMPLFSRAFLNSPSKEVTSVIWYNLSFVPLNLGFKNLAIACLRLALKNDSQNEEAVNNLGVLKFGQLVSEEIHFTNKQELWGAVKEAAAHSNSKLERDSTEENKLLGGLFDQAETYFSQLTDHESQEQLNRLERQPETLYNMALIKHRRGQLLASVKYCDLYLEHDPDNYHIRNILKEIRQLVSHDG